MRLGQNRIKSGMHNLGLNLNIIPDKKWKMIPDKNWKDNARNFQLALANEPTSAMGVILNTILMIGGEFLRAAGYLSTSPHRQSQINNFIMDKVHVH